MLKNGTLPIVIENYSCYHRYDSFDNESCKWVEKEAKKVSTKNSNTSQELFNLNGKPSFGQALPLAFQHVVAMIIGCVAPAIILAGVSGLSESDTVVLIQASLAMSAISTFIQLFPFIKFKSYQIGAGLPVIMGISFAYVPIMQSIAQDADVGTILGAQIVGGIVAIIVEYLSSRSVIFSRRWLRERLYFQSDFRCIRPQSIIGRWSRKVRIMVHGRTGLLRSSHWQS